MKLVNMKELLLDASKKGYAVPAINVSNMETINGLMETAAIMKSPVIFQIAPIQLKLQKIEPEYFVQLVKLSEKKYDVKYAIHLDHGNDLNELQACADAGFTSMMYDGSSLSFEDNIANTKLARKIAKDDITLEGELGILMGQEGSDEQAESKSIYTDPDEAEEFVNRTNVDCLAVSIGNAHGYYKGEPMLNFDVLDKISKKIKIPVVMHGASGLSEKDIMAGIKHGIAKINFFTAVDYQFTSGINQKLKKDPKIYMMEYMESARQSMMNEIGKVIKMCGSDNRL